MCNTASAPYTHIWRQSSFVTHSSIYMFNRVFLTPLFRIISSNRVAICRQPILLYYLHIETDRKHTNTPQLLYYLNIICICCLSSSSFSIFLFQYIHTHKNLFQFFLLYLFQYRRLDPQTLKLLLAVRPPR